MPTPIVVLPDRCSSQGIVFDSEAGSCLPIVSLTSADQEQREARLACVVEVVAKAMLQYLSKCVCLDARENCWKDTEPGKAEMARPSTRAKTAFPMSYTRPTVDSPGI